MIEATGVRRLPLSATPVAGATPACWQVDLDDDALDALAGLLDDDERQRAARFVRPRLTRRYVRAHGALRWLLGRHCGVDGAALRFNVNAHGKPALIGAVAAGASPHFNLSHSDGHALVAISDDAPVGVDIETLRALEDLQAWGPSQLSDREQAEWQRLPADQRDAAFLRGWTRKEAALKALGVGLTIAQAAQIDVGLAPCHGAASLGYGGWTLPWLGPVDCTGPVVASLALADPLARH